MLWLESILIEITGIEPFSDFVYVIASNTAEDMRDLVTSLAWSDSVSFEVVPRRRPRSSLVAILEQV